MFEWLFLLLISFVPLELHIAVQWLLLSRGAEQQLAAVGAHSSTLHSERIFLSSFSKYRFFLSAYYGIHKSTRNALSSQSLYSAFFLFPHFFRSFCHSSRHILKCTHINPPVTIFSRLHFFARALFFLIVSCCFCLVSVDFCIHSQWCVCNCVQKNIKENAQTFLGVLGDMCVCVDLHSNVNWNNKIKRYRVDLIISLVFFLWNSCIKTYLILIILRFLFGWR